MPEEENQTTETTEEQQPTVQPSDGLTYQDIYNAVYNGYMDAYQEIKISEAEAAAQAAELEDEETEEPIYKVDIENFPKTQKVQVSNMPDQLIDYASLSDAMAVNTSDQAVEFASGTDAKLYTCSVSSSLSTASEQIAAYSLDTRNILLIFLLLWFTIYMIKMLKDTVVKVSNKRKGVK